MLSSRPATTGLGRLRRLAPSRLCCARQRPATPPCHAGPSDRRRVGQLGLRLGLQHVLALACAFLLASPVLSELSTAVCSITPTRRRRFFWAAWWTGEPTLAPFRKPDAASGGARSYDEALRDAQTAAGRQLTLIDAHWARAWQGVLRGEPPAAPREPGPKRARSAGVATAPAGSAWAALGLAPGAPSSEVKRAYRKRALETHPDQGGDAEAFQIVQRAYEKLTAPRRIGPRKA
jgi:hypothetical protein